MDEERQASCGRPRCPAVCIAVLPCMSDCWRLLASTEIMAPFQSDGPPALPLLQRRTSRVSSALLSISGSSVSCGSGGMGAVDGGWCMSRSCRMMCESAQSSGLLVLMTARDATSRWPAATRRRVRRMACVLSRVLSSLRSSPTSGSTSLSYLCSWSAGSALPTSRCCCDAACATANACASRSWSRRRCACQSLTFSC